MASIGNIWICDVCAIKNKGWNPILSSKDLDKIYEVLRKLSTDEDILSMDWDIFLK